MSRPSRKAWTRTGTPAAAIDVGERGDVRLVRVHPARREQAHEVAAPPVDFSLAMKSASAGLLRQRAVLDRAVDARQVLQHHPAGADIHVADLGIAHLPVGQADLVLGGVEQRVRRARRNRSQLGVAASAIALSGPSSRDAPAVEDAQHDRAGALGPIGHGRAI